MNTLKVGKYQLQDMLRNRGVLAYGLFFLVLTDALFRFGGTGERVILSLMNVVIVLVPLVAVILGAIYLYGAREYVELLLSQPIGRRELFRGLCIGLIVPLVAAFVLGTALPFLWHGAALSATGAFLVLLLTGSLLTAIFVALSFAIALATEDRIRGLGIAIAVWMFFAVAYDGLVLLGIETFSAYPLQRAVIGAALLNPVDLGRILLLLNLDASALMGFTGAVFQRFFGSVAGQAVTVAALLAWLAVPLLLAERAFARKNF